MSSLLCTYTYVPTILKGEQSIDNLLPEQISLNLANEPYVPGYPNEEITLQPLSIILYRTEEKCIDSTTAARSYGPVYFR